MTGGVLRVPETVRRRALSEGPVGLAWLEALEQTVSDLARQWSLTIGPVLDGGSAALVCSARAADDTDLVLKLPTPGSLIGRQEAAILRAADGRGYVRLIRHDSASGALLLERLGARLDQLGLSYVEQVDIVCSALLSAWRRPPTDIALSNGAEKANGLAALVIRLWHQMDRPFSEAVFDKTLMYCRDRAAAWRPETAVMAHGDPHPANVLLVPESSPHQFRFIDPDGLVIEPAYDLGVLLRGWHDGIGGRHAHDIARSHARHLTTRTQVPAEAIWQWGYIERVSTGLHLLELGETEEGRKYLAVAEAVTLRD